jgi:hypothetical protein
MTTDADAGLLHRVVPPRFSREWAMPSADTFDVPPIRDFVQKYLTESAVSCDPFARNKRWATYTNDINPATAAEHHMDAEAFLRQLAADGVKCDLAIIDPPYSPRQMSECYQAVGLAVGRNGTQNSALYARVRDALVDVLADDAIVLSFGWNSAGMGVSRGFDLIECVVVCHGAAHNDTICIAEARRPDHQKRFGW